MYRPAEEYYDSDYEYDGFSFGEEFREKPKHNQYNGFSKQEEKESGEKEIYESICNGQLEILKQLLLKFDFDNLDQPLNFGWPPLLCAARNLQYDIVEYLISQGANVNCHIDSLTPLMTICSNIDNDSDQAVKIIQLLYDNGALVNISDRHGTTPLMRAVSNGDKEIVNFLLPLASLEAKDNQGNTALFYAIQNNNFEMVKLLLNSGADINAENKFNLTPKLMAIRNNSSEEIINLFPQPDDEYIVPSTYISYSNYTDLAPTIFPDNEIPVFFPDVASILTGVHSSEFLELFAKNNINLIEFLTITDEKLAQLGIILPYHRKKILLGILKFHKYPWSPATVQCVNREMHQDLYDIFLVLSSHLKHLIVLNTSIDFILNNTVGNSTLLSSTSSPSPSTDPYQPHHNHVKSIDESIDLIINEIRQLINSTKCIETHIKQIDEFTPRPVQLIDETSLKYNKVGRSLSIMLLKYSTVISVCLYGFYRFKKLF